MWGRKTILPVLHRRNVDIVFAGHSHVYERFVPILAGALDNPRPMTHIVTGPTGGEIRGTHDDSILAKHYSGYNFVVVTVNGPHLTGKAIDIKGQAFDTFAFSREGGVYDAHYMAKAVSRRREGGPVEAFAGGDARVPGTLHEAMWEGAQIGAAM
jgi:hypothetical protein